MTGERNEQSQSVRRLETGLKYRLIKIGFVLLPKSCMSRRVEKGCVMCDTRKSTK